MSYADANEVPITLKIGGKEITIRPLTQRDYLPWLDELTEAVKKSDRALIPATMKPQEKFALLRQIEMSEVIPADLEPRVFTAKGTIKILQMALMKAKVSEGDADQFIDSQSSNENERLAVRVSGLFSSDRIASMYARSSGQPDARSSGQPDPNPPAPVSGANQ